MERTGRVVRLHFQCRAEIPIGSFLRVTGSTLWAPGTAANDPAELHSAASGTDPEEESSDNMLLFPNNGQDDEVLANMIQPTSALYTSSVEMVTTPEDYPIWKTRKPVVVVIHNHKKSVQHHYYRYLVVSPGGTIGDLEMMDNNNSPLVSTSNETTGSTPVMQWEDPFGSLKASPQRAGGGEASNVSLTSNMMVTRLDYRNLPYRTLDIDVQTGLPVLEEVRCDHWNMPDDVSFRPYRIREAIHAENRRKMLDSGESSGEATPPAVSATARIFFVCFHLPVVVVQSKSTGQWRASWSESILAKTEGSAILSAYDRHWVGTVTTHPPLQSEADKEAVRAILKEMNCIPIFLDPQTRQAHYFGFCKAVLWPAFHNIDLLDLSTSGWLVSGKDDTASDWDQSRLNDWWNCYRQVNTEFCNLLSGMVRNGDIVWIHDYHLSLLPKQLSDWEYENIGHRLTRKVFFLHIPFPTSQIFRELDAGESLLEGMLEADVVGFHAFDHARHFLNAAKRILGLNYESLAGGLIGVSYQGRTVLVSMSNVSISPRMIDAAMLLPSVNASVRDLQMKHSGRIILASVDIGQRLSGTALKLLAFERLLQDYPTWQTKVVLIQRLLMPGSRQADELETAREVHGVIKRIQERFGENVVDYQELHGSSLPMDQRLALWKAANILVATPIREGLNHWPMEYIYAHKAPETPGVVITSEFSAVSSILNGALRVNPFDIQNTIITIDKALSMHMAEREGRRYRDIEFVSNCPSDKWVKNVLRDLRDATARQRHSESNSATPTLGSFTPRRTIAATAATGTAKSSVIDSTASFLAREASLAFLPLDLKALKRAYDVTKRRVILLDFNGTIVMKEPPGKYLKREILGTSGNKPPPAVVQALTKLCADPNNTVYVVSGDSSENVVDALGHVPNLGLAVSNGARFSPPNASWRTFDLGVDWDAVKRVALPILSKYTARSNGSWIKLTSFSIGWSYYSTDPEWGSLQASHLLLELENELRAFDVRFVTLKGIIEIVPRKLNKGLIVKKVLRDIQQVDFVLCFGDDISDEKMFTSVFTFLAEVGGGESKPGPPVVLDNGQLEQATTTNNTTIPEHMYCFTCAVGKKPSHASTYVDSGQDVANALVLLATGDIPTGGVPIWNRASNFHMFD